MTDSMPAAGPTARASRVARPAVAADGLARAAPRAAMVAAPLAVGSLAIALASAVVLMHSSPWHAAWSAAATVAIAAMVATALAAAHPRTPATLAEPLARGYAGAGILAMLLLGLAPWLPGPADAAGANRLYVLALGMAAIGAAAAFASLRAPAALAASMPLSPAFAEWWAAEETATAMPADAFAGALIGGVALLVGLACRRTWLRDARAAIAGSERIRALEADRDAARRADRESRHLLAMASRDLRQPVNALGLFAATLEQRLRASGDELLVHNLVRSVDGLDRSLGAMLDLTRLDAAAPGSERVVLDELFRRLAARFAPDAARAGLRLRFAAGTKTADGDPQLLERLLAHLVQDALRRTARGGVTVVARHATAGTQLHLEVWDTGSGLAEALLDDGAPSASAPPALSLAIVERLAQRLGSRLSTVARPGRGTRVRVAVPVSAPAAGIRAPLPSRSAGTQPQH